VSTLTNLYLTPSTHDNYPLTLFQLNIKFNCGCQYCFLASKVTPEEISGRPKIFKCTIKINKSQKSLAAIQGANEQKAITNRYENSAEEQ
jgi:hypothetical protein